MSICKIEYHFLKSSTNFSIIEASITQLISTLSKPNVKEIILIKYGCRYEIESDIKISIDEDRSMLYYTNSSGVKIDLVLKNFMWFRVSLEDIPNCLYECLNAELTSTGDSQLNLLEDELMTLSKISRKTQKIYAPFTSLIQSSGFGKTKICLELIKKHPGVYLVFRDATDSGIPYMAPYMKEFMNFIINAPKDELPMDTKDIKIAKALNFTPGRFLIALYALIKAYHDLLLKTIKKLSEEESKSAMNPEIIAEAILLLGENYMLEPNEKSSYNINVDFTALQENDFDFYIRNISKECNSINNLIKSDDQPYPFPFLVLFDEADVFNRSNLKGKILGISIIRRGLHILSPDIPLLALAIGTNSDALDFSPEVNDDSLRVVTQNTLLPPLIMSGNWDIFSSTLEFNSLQMGKKDMLNPAFFNVLATMGRALWSSCNLGKVVAIAQKKLKNGNSDCIGALIAPLLVRANIDVNVNHVLARNLIKSYMIIVTYVSTDAKNLKITYSSEPILAFAARNLLSPKGEREKSFRALKKMLEDKAIDKGRIVEVVFEHLALFAIDDSKMMIKLGNDGDVSEKNMRDETRTGNDSLPLQIGAIMSKTSHVLDQKKQKNDDILLTFPDYRVVTLNEYFAKLLKTDLFETEIKPMLHPSVLNGLANVSHFIQAEHLIGEEFKGLYDKNLLVKLMKKVIDRSVLKGGIIRTLGIVMPPGYPGIDFFIPFLIDDPEGKFKRPLYSFIAFQSKASKPTTSDCAVKMAANLHLIVCPHPDHGTYEDCARVNCSAGFTREEIEEICAHQVAVILSAKNDATVNNERKAKITVAVKDHMVHGPSKTADDRKRIKAEKDAILKLSRENYQNHICQAEIIVQSQAQEREFDQEIQEQTKPSGNKRKRKVNHEENKQSTPTTSVQVDNNVPLSGDSFPVFSKTPDCEIPDFILTKVINFQVTVQRMVWNESHVTDLNRDLNDLKLQDQDFKPELKYNTKSKKLQSKSITEKASISSDFLNTNRSRTLTCIDIHDIWAFDGLISKNTIAIIVEIISMTNSNFHSVEPIHLPIVQNSMINAICCPYLAINPFANLIRNFRISIDPTKNNRVQQVFEDNWQSTINSCADGPIKSTLDPKHLSDSYYEAYEPKKRSKV